MNENNRNKRIEVRVTSSEEKQIKRNAEKEGKSISAFVIVRCTQENVNGTDVSATREILTKTIQMQNELNCLRNEQQKLNSEIEKMDQGG